MYHYYIFSILDEENSEYYFKRAILPTSIKNDTPEEREHLHHALRAYGNYLLKYKNDMINSEKYLRKAIETSPLYLEGLIDLGFLLTKKKSGKTRISRKEALNLFRRYI